MVAVQLRRSASLGKAEMPGVGDIIRFISSDCNLHSVVLAAISRESRSDGLDTPLGDIHVVHRRSWSRHGLVCWSSRGCLT